jgi:hypothetical protein
MAHGRYECVILGDRDEINDLKFSVNSKAFLLVLSEMCNRASMSASVIMSQYKVKDDKLYFLMSSIEHQMKSKNTISLVEDNSLDANSFVMFKLENPFTVGLKMDALRGFVNFAVRSKSSYVGLSVSEPKGNEDNDVMLYRVRMNFKADTITGENDHFINVRPKGDGDALEVVSGSDYEGADFQVQTYYQEFPVDNISAFLKDMDTQEIQVSMCNDSPLLIVSEYTSKTFWRVYLGPNSELEGSSGSSSTKKKKKSSDDTDD